MRDASDLAILQRSAATAVDMTENLLEMLVSDAPIDPVMLINYHENVAKIKRAMSVVNERNPELK